MLHSANGTHAGGKAGRWKRLTAGLLLLSPWPLAALKPSGNPPDAPPMRIEVRGQAPEGEHPQPGSVTQAAFQREIVDPCLGTRWQLVADAQHPERPGHLVLVDSRALRSSGTTPAGSPPSTPASTTQLPVIRAGDRIAVLQQTPILRGRFQAVALESAATGQTLRVRLLGNSDTLTGNLGTIVDVRALRAGEAAWL